jgi:DNA (cytosine-5)-methyltransferase 1
VDLVLSTFTGAGLLDRGFELEGFCVVSAGDFLWGRDVRNFTPSGHTFKGVIGGPPCQEFSGFQKRFKNKVTGVGLEMVNQFARIVGAASPDWFLMENVPAVPTLEIDGYKIQRLNLNAAECGLKQNRLRCFQFGSRDGSMISPARCVTTGDVEKCVLASEGKRSKSARRGFPDVCALQGLPRDFLSGSDLPQWLKYQLDGNGVPVPMARILAAAVKARTKFARFCVCDCGRIVQPGATLATPACRKRMQRRRHAAAVNVTGPDTLTPATSQLLLA